MVPTRAYSIRGHELLIHVSMLTQIVRLPSHGRAEQLALIGVFTRGSTDCWSSDRANLSLDNLRLAGTDWLDHGHLAASSPPVSEG